MLLDMRVPRAARCVGAETGSGPVLSSYGGLGAATLCVPGAHTAGEAAPNDQKRLRRERPRSIIAACRNRNA